MLMASLSALSQILRDLPPANTKDVAGRDNTAVVGSDCPEHPPSPPALGNTHSIAAESQLEFADLEHHLCWDGQGRQRASRQVCARNALLRLHVSRGFLCTYFSAPAPFPSHPLSSPVLRARQCATKPSQTMAQQCD